MIFKWKFILIFIGVSIGFYCSGVGKNKEQPIKDVYDRPIIDSLRGNECVYYSEDGKEITTYLGGVEFNGGRDSLSNYLLKKYVNHPHFNNEEYNIIEHFILLLNKNLEIKEIRIVYRKGYDNKRFYYDSIFIDALKSTTGMWYKTVEDKEWYVYLHRQRVY